MTTLPSLSQEITTINYTLSWPHLHHPSNTTFAGPTQFDICTCGSKPGENSKDLGHLYTRYRCARPEVRFAGPDEELWILHAPLGQVNLLRPARQDEVERRKVIHKSANADIYKGKNILLLTGPCPRGRYQAFATLRFLQSLSPACRQAVECISLLIQPYEEDCSNDQGGRAYVELARYILEELPAFKTLCLNIWGEETKLSTREFAVLLWREGVNIVVSWDWAGEHAEVYSDVEGFLKGVEDGTVEKRPPWEGEKREIDRYENGDAGSESGIVISPAQEFISPSSSRQTSIFRGQEREDVVWEEITSSATDHKTDQGIISSPILLKEDEEEEVTSKAEAEASSEDDWSDAMLMPVSPDRTSTGSDGTWQIL